MTTYINDSKPNDPPKPIQACAKSPCIGDHAGWRSWTKANTKAAIVNLHSTKRSPFLNDPNNATFYRELLAAIDTSTILV